MARLRGPLLVFAVFVASACGDGEPAETDPGSDPGEHVVTADDGSATLTIPEGALPDGVEPADIRISRITNEDGDSPDDATAIYRFEPDGLQLSEQAVLNMTVDSPGGYLPVVMHVGSNPTNVEGFDEPIGTSAETVTDLSVVYDVELGTVELSVPLQHFSDLSVRWSEDYAFWKISGTSDFKALLGQKPTVSATIVNQATELTAGEYPGPRVFVMKDSEYYGWSDFRVWLGGTRDWQRKHYKSYDNKKGHISMRFTLVPDSVFIKGAVEPRGGFGEFDAVTPRTKVRNRPSRTAITAQHTISNQDFTCNKVGPDEIYFDFNLEWTETAELQREWNPEWRRINDNHHYLSVSVRTKVKCEGGDATTTTTSTTTTTLPLDTTTTTSTTTTTLPPETTTSTTSTTTSTPTETSSTTTAAPTTSTTTTTTTTTAPPETSKAASASLPCPESSTTQTTWLDVFIPDDATGASHSITDALNCSDTTVTVSGRVIESGASDPLGTPSPPAGKKTYRIVFDTTGHVGAVGGSDATSAVISWTNP